MKILEYVNYFLGFESEVKSIKFSKHKKDKIDKKTHKTITKNKVTNSNQAAFVLSTPNATAPKPQVNIVQEVTKICPANLDELAVSISKLRPNEEAEVDLTELAQQDLAFEIIVSICNKLNLTPIKNGDLVALQKTQK